MSKRKPKSEIIRNHARREKRGFFKTLILWSFLLGLLLVICGAGAGLVLYYSISKDLPKITSLADYHPSIITTVYADDNRKIAEFFKERRIVIPLKDMPRTLIGAFVAAEDSRFYKHQGIDFISIVRAFFKNLTLHFLFFNTFIFIPTFLCFVICCDFLPNYIIVNYCL